MRCFIGVIFTLILELIACIALAFLYLINNDDRRSNCKRTYDAEYLIYAVAIAVCLIFIGVLLCFSYNLIALFT
jgi:hypothetical protein